MAAKLRPNSSNRDDKLDASPNGERGQTTLIEALPKLEERLHDNEDLIRSWRQNIATDGNHRGNEVRKDSVHDERPEPGNVIDDLESRNNVAVNLYAEYRTKAISSSGQLRRGFFDSRNDSSLISLSSLRFDSQPQPSPRDSIEERSSAARDNELGTDSVPDQEVLDGWIRDYQNAAAREQDAHNYQQAEANLNNVMRWGDTREHHYSVPFTNRLQVYEELATLYQRQGKYGEAISQVGEMQRKLSPLSSTNKDQWAESKLVSARHNQLLASIYLDRYKASQSESDSRNSDSGAKFDDLESANRHGQAAFKARNQVRKSTGDLGLDLQQHRECICLIIDVFEAKGDPIGAKSFREKLDESSGSRARRWTETTLTEDDRSFLKEGAILRSVRSGDSDATSGLIQAVEESNKDAVIKLLDPNDLAANVNTADDDGWTALHHASRLGDHAIVYCLLQHDADKDCVTNRNETPLLVAVRGDHREVTKLLLDSGARAQRKYANDWSLLHYAIWKEKTDITKLLLKRCPDLKGAKDNVGMTAIHHCAKNSANSGFLDHAKVLLQHDKPADVNAEDNVKDEAKGSKGRSPLYIAVSSPAILEREQMAALLIKEGATVDISGLPRKYLRDYDCLRRNFRKK